MKQCQFCPTTQSISCQSADEAKRCTWRMHIESEAAKNLPKMTKAEERALLRQMMQ